MMSSFRFRFIRKKVYDTFTDIFLHWGGAGDTL